MRPPPEDWKIILTPAVAVAGMLAVATMIGVDIVRELPQRPATSAQIARDGPAALARWRAIYPRLEQRLQAWQPRPPELGAVWSTRSGEICGLMDEWHTGLDQMTRFYTIDGAPHFREDNIYSYMKGWSECVDHPWMLIHSGTLEEGSCASDNGHKLFLDVCAPPK